MISGLVQREKARYELELTLKRRLLSPEYCEEWGTDFLHDGLARIVQQRTDEVQELVKEWERICPRLNDEQTAKFTDIFSKAMVYLEERGAKEPVWFHENQIAETAERN